MEKKETLVYIYILSFIVISLSVFIFLKSFNNLDVEGDGFIYLIFSKYNIIGRPIRSPIIKFFLIPDIHLARIEMAVFHILNSILIFLIIKKITNKNILGFFGGTLYGTCWWYVDYTRYVLMELPALFFTLLAIYFLTNQNKLKYFISGSLLGLAFIVKPNFGIFFIIVSILFFLKKDKSISLFLISFLLISVFLELLLDYIILKPKIKYLIIVYTPWELLKFNFFSQVKVGGFYNSLSLNFLFKRILSAEINPLIEPLFRWVLFPIIPFFIIGLSFLLKNLYSIKTKFLLTCIVLLYFIINSFLLFTLKIPEFRPDLVQIPKTREIASNYPQAVSYYSGEGSLDIFLREKYHEADINRTFNIINNYKYLVLFDHPSTSKSLFQEIKNYADKKLQLLSNYENGWSVYVYKNTDVKISIDIWS